MEEAKRKQIETRLRQMINAADRDPKENAANGRGTPGNIQVIRKRKGRSTPRIDEKQHRPEASAPDVG